MLWQSEEAVPGSPSFVHGGSRRRVHMRKHDDASSAPPASLLWLLRFHHRHRAVSGFLNIVVVTALLLGLVWLISPT